MTTRAEATRRFYGPGRKEGGSIDNAIDSWETRRAAKFVDHPVLARQVRAEAKHLKAHMQKFGWTPEEAQTALAKLHEREISPRGEESKALLRPQIWGNLVEKLGSEEAARALLKNAEKAQIAFAADCPSVAQRAAEIGAAEDPDIIEIFSRHHEPVSTTTQE